MSCDCYRVGGPWIAEDPNCPQHGYEAQAEQERREEQRFETEQELNRLRGQVTYLQEELASTEDEMAKRVDRLESKIADLEQLLGDALNNRGM